MTFPAADRDVRAVEIEALRASPDQAVMAAMEDAMLKISVRIAALDVRDDAAVNAVIEANCEPSRAPRNVKAAGAGPLQDIQEPRVS